MNIVKIRSVIDWSKLQYKWRHSLVILILCISIIFLFYANTVKQMIGLWSGSDTYAHGFIVPFISLWLIWRIRSKWIDIELETSWFALILMFITALVWFAGNIVAVNAITQLALVSMIILCFPAVLGWPVTLVISFPLLFLYFSVPIGDFMLPRMMEWTADFTVLALRKTGIPVYREGLQFVIPSGNWSVVEACSGIRYLIASVTVGCLFAYINYQSYLKRFAFVVVSIIVPLIANWLRAYMIVLIGHYSGNELATGIDHLVYGWLFFGLVIIMMLFVGARWTDEPENLVYQPSVKKEKKINYFNRKFYFMIIISIIIMPHLFESWIDSKKKRLPVVLESLTVKEPWIELPSTPSDWTPEFQQASAQVNLGFHNDIGIEVGLHISYYRQQTYKSKLVTSSNVLVASSNKNWSQINKNTKKLILKGKDYIINESVVQHKGSIGTEGKKSLNIWYFYWVNGNLTASDIEAKIQGALSQIQGKGDDGAIVAVYVPYKSSESLVKDIKFTNTILKDFMDKNYNSIVLSLQKTQEK